jgi:SH3 domain-containing YSC84-like protein 1
MLPQEYDLRNPQRVCQRCHEKLLPVQRSLIREYANHTRVNLVESSKQFNLPFSKTLGSEIRKATSTIQQLLEQDVIEDTSFTLSLLGNAKGIAFLTVVKGGFIFAPRFGTGLVMSRLLDGRSRFPSPLLLSSLKVSDGQPRLLLRRLDCLGAP